MHLFRLLPALILAAAVVAGCGDDQPPPAADLPVTTDRGGPDAPDGPSSDLDSGEGDSGDLAVADALLCGGKSCDDKLKCTDDLCVATGCLNKIKSGHCLIDGKCYKNKDTSGSGSCKLCDAATANKAWTFDVSLCVDDGLTCTSAQCKAGLCEDVLLSGNCLVGGVCVKDGATDPKNDCRKCDVVLSTSSYKNKADGAACADDKLKCTDDKCSGGACVHPLKAGYCKIMGTCYLNAELNPLQDCQVCDTAKVATDWSVRPDGSKCTDDGLACTDDLCTSGNCKNFVKTGNCLINTNCYTGGTVNPSSECQTCDPKTSTTAWSNKTDGAACTADSLSCTEDACKAGKCNHALKANSCMISGACYASGAKQPNKDCRGCNPATSTSAWSVLPDGAACGSDLYSCTNDVCTSGACTHALKTGHCLIGGTCYKAGQGHYSVDCLACEPATSASSWSPATDGTACKADAYSCTSDVCTSGSCTHPLATGKCLIQSSCYSAGAKHPGVDCLTCNPTYSTGSWSAAADGVSCTDEGIGCTTDSCKGGKCAHALETGKCLIQGKCYSSGAINPANSCLSCAPTSATSTWSGMPYGTACPSDSQSCTTDVCNGSGKCSHYLKSGNCLIAGQCYASGIENPNNSCQLCDPNKSTTSWTARADLTTCTGGKCKGGSCCQGCISGSVCMSGSGDAACGSGGGSCISCAASASYCQFGSCFSLGCKARPGPGCSSCDCEPCVCKIDPYCCGINWDNKCVNYCRHQCKGKCP